MLVRLTRWLLAASWIAAAVLSFQVVEDASRTTPLGATVNLTVVTYQGNASAAQLRAELIELARQEGITLAQVVPDNERNRSVRGVYLVAGDSSAPGPEPDGDDFGDAMSTRVHPLADLGLRSPFGKWVIFGDPSHSSLVTSFFNDRGAQTVTRTVPDLPRLMGVAPSVYPVLLTVGLLLIGTSGAFVVSRTHRYAVQRLHGASAYAVWLRDIGPLLRIWGISGAAVTTTAALGAWLWSGGAGVLLFSSQTALFASCFLAVAMGTHAIVFVMVASVDILGALKGNVPGGATVTAYALRAAAVFVALGLASGTVSQVLDNSERTRAAQPLRELGEAAVLTFGNAYTEKDQNALGATVQPWLRTMDRQGDLIIAYRDSIGGQGSGIAYCPVLMVNEPFLAEQRVELASGEQVTADPRQGQIVVPDHLWSQREKVLGELEALLDFRLRGGSVQADQLLHGSDGQTIFSLQVPSSTSNPLSPEKAFVADPIVIVMPPGQFDSYVTAATSGQVLIRDRASTVPAIQQDPQLSRFIVSVTPVSARADVVAARESGQLRSSLISTGTAYVVVLMAGTAVTIAYTSRHAQRVLVRHLHGWRFASIYSRLLALESFLLAVILGWVPWQIYQEREELLQMAQVAPIPGRLPTAGVADLLPIIMLALITTGGFLATLVIVHRRVVRRGTSEG